MMWYYGKCLSNGDEFTITDGSDLETVKSATLYDKAIQLSAPVKTKALLEQSYYIEGYKVPDYISSHYEMMEYLDEAMCCDPDFYEEL